MYNITMRCFDMNNYECSYEYVLNMSCKFFIVFIGSEGVVALRKRKTYILGVAIVFALLITFIIFVFDFIENKNDINWIKDCPVIPIKIGNKNVALEFDTGNGMGIFITTALKDKIDYEIVGTTTELNADGTYRGEGTSISLKTIKVFGDEFQNVMSSLNDWRMYGFFKINGTIGLKYFDNKVVTLDYDNKKIAVSNKTLDYPLKLAINSDLLKANHFVIIIDKIQNNLILCKN